MAETTRLAALASLGLGERIPGSGWTIMTAPAQLAYAAKLLALHLPTEPLIGRSQSPPSHDRRCRACQQPWVCEYVLWAQDLGPRLQASRDRMSPPAPVDLAVPAHSHALPE